MSTTKRRPGRPRIWRNDAERMKVTRAWKAAGITPDKQPKCDAAVREIINEHLAAPSTPVLPVPTTLGSAPNVRQIINEHSPSPTPAEPAETRMSATEYLALLGKKQLKPEPEELADVDNDRPPIAEIAGLIGSTNW